MSIHHLRARLDALKRKYALPILILRLRLRAEKLCRIWEAADIAERSHQQRFPDTTLMIPDFGQDGPLLPTFITYRGLDRYLARTRRAKIHPTPHGIVRSILPKTHKTGLLGHVMKIYLRDR